MDNKSLGQIAYEAYKEVVDVILHSSGQISPLWDRLPSELQVAWEHSAQEVRDCVKLDPTENWPHRARHMSDLTEKTLRKAGFVPFGAVK